MALHNPGDPAYRAKKGNLFSTYLSATDPEKPGTYNDPTGRRTEKKIEKLLERDRSAKAKFERSSGAERCRHSPRANGRAPAPSGSTETAAGCCPATLTISRRNASIEKAPFPGLFP